MSHSGVLSIALCCLPVVNFVKEWREEVETCKLLSTFNFFWKFLIFHLLHFTSCTFFIFLIFYIKERLGWLWTVPGAIKGTIIILILLNLHILFILHDIFFIFRHSHIPQKYVGSWLKHNNVTVFVVGCLESFLHFHILILTGAQVNKEIATCRKLHATCPWRWGTGSRLGEQGCSYSCPVAQASSHRRQ